MEAFFRPQNKK